MSATNKHHPYTSVAEIQINITLEGNNLTTWHTWATQAPRVVTFHDDYQRVGTGSYLALAPSSMRYLDGHPWVARTLSHYISMKWGNISSNLVTVEATKFAGPHKSRMCQYIINLVPRGQTIGPQLTQVGATTSELRIWHQTTLNLPIQYSPQPPSWPHPVTHRTTNPIANINHIEPPSWEGGLSRAAFDHSSSTKSLNY
jgi:hypothetical protein